MNTKSITKQRLITKYHTLCSKLGMSVREKREMLESNFGVTSSKELHEDELKILCNNLESTSPKKYKDELDQDRKRLIAALFSYLRFIGYSPNIDYVKEVARKAAKVKTFNSISPNKLKQLYRIFGEMKKKKSKEWTDEVLDKIAEQVV